MPSHNPPGTRSSDLYDWEPEDLDEMSSTLATHQVREHLTEQGSDFIVL